MIMMLLRKWRLKHTILKDVELKNYAEFGLGAEKIWFEDGVNSFFEITRREGGREGWNGLAGVKLAF